MSELGGHGGPNKRPADDPQQARRERANETFERWCTENRITPNQRMRLTRDGKLKNESTGETLRDSKVVPRKPVRSTPESLADSVAVTPIGPEPNDKLPLLADATKALREAKENAIENSVLEQLALLGNNRTQDLSRSEVKSVRSLATQLAYHERKLKAYRDDPDSYDHRGILKDAPSSAIRDRIIEGRIRHLQSEIKGFGARIRDVLEGE